MARILIVGCGCRGQSLARELAQRGHVVRGTTRSSARFAALEAAGVQPYCGDPNRVGTLVAALDAVTVLCWLLGSATGTANTLSALHSVRLAMMLRRIADTTVRGVVYEAVGSVDPALLAQGKRQIISAQRIWGVPTALITTSPTDHDQWLQDAVEANLSLL